MRKSEDAEKANPHSRAIGKITTEKSVPGTRTKRADNNRKRQLQVSRYVPRSKAKLMVARVVKADDAKGPVRARKAPAIRGPTSSRRRDVELVRAQRHRLKL